MIQAPATIPVPAAPPKSNTWWIVPLAIVGLVVIAWLLLAGLPFGGREEKRIATTATTETIAEGTATNARPMDTGTVVDIAPDPPLETTTTPPPNPVVIEERPPVAQPPARDEPAEEITDGEALSTLRNYLASNHPYDVPGDCLQTRSMGYQNAGYTYSVWNTCLDGGGSRMLGRWRIDAKTREIFRQGDDGRYLRP